MQHNSTAWLLYMHILIIRPIQHNSLFFKHRSASSYRQRKTSHGKWKNIIHLDGTMGTPQQARFQRYAANFSLNKSNLSEEIYWISVRRNTPVAQPDLCATIYNVLFTHSRVYKTAHIYTIYVAERRQCSVILLRNCCVGQFSSICLATTISHITELVA